MEGTGKKLKIAVLIRRFIETGGAERYAVEVSRRLAQSHEVHVFAQEWDREFPGIHHHRVPRLCEKPRFINQWHFSLWTQRHVGREFDIVHSYEMMAHFDVMTVQSMTVRADVWPGGGFDLKKLWTRVQTLTSPRLLAYLWLEKLEYTLRPGRRWIVPARYVSRQIEDVYGVSAGRMPVAPSAVDARFFHPPNAGTDRLAQRAAWSVGPDDLVYLFVGTEFGRKGLDCLLQGFARMDRKGCRLVVVGGGDTERFAARARQLGVADAVAFVGLTADVHSAYYAADVFVLPTLRDPCPLSPLEAMASGLPVILSGPRYNGTAELVTDAESILVAEPTDIDAMRRALEAMKDERRRERMAAAGRHRVTRFTWEAAAAVAEATYADVLAERNA